MFSSILCTKNHCWMPCLEFLNPMSDILNPILSANNTYNFFVLTNGFEIIHFHVITYLEIYLVIMLFFRFGQNTTTPQNNALNQYMLVLASMPFGDSPLFKNLVPVSIFIYLFTTPLNYIL